MKKQIIIFSLLFIVSVFPQDSNFDAAATKGIKQIYNIKFDSAAVTFRSLMADYPSHPAGRFFLAMIDWWKILLDIDNESNDDIFYQKLEDVIYQCDEILDKDPENIDALFFKGGAIGFRGRLHAYRESWIKAADDGREALPIVERASLLDPNNIDVQLGFGIYNYYADVIPNDYPMLKPLMIFFPDGDKQKGIEQLTNTALNGKYAKYEARYFLATLYYSYENNAFMSDKYIDMLRVDFPDNPTFQRWKGRVAAKMGNYATASLVFKDFLRKADENKPGYNNLNAKREGAYYIGLQFRYTNELDSANYFLEKCAEYSKILDEGKEESGFIINAYLYLGMINDAQGKREKAIEFYNKLLDMREYGRSHEMAKQYLAKPSGS
ncbi:MAG: hypothetical protein K8H86_02205 [Ignavibacteriaceae bacterium]|nr:hypothetical protein [Ignavibacteriaceae bacterium]